MNDSLTHELAAYAAATTTEAIPADVRERGKLVILDEMASAFFGRRRPAGQLASTYAQSFAAYDEAQILGTDVRVSAPYAALANGTAGHADEIDGAHVVGGHPGATIVHSAVAMAERQHATGSELLNAVILGYDIGTRLVDACGGIFVTKKKFSVHADMLYGLGATTGNARLLNLTTDQHCHALALATFQVNGLCALFHERRHISKALCNGQYAQAAVHSALMAAAGLEGVDDILAEQHGLLDAWGLEDSVARVTRELGSDFAVMKANFKFARAGYPIHGAVEAAMSLVNEHSLTAQDIATVAVGMPENPMRVVDNRDMHNICLQDMMTVALVRGGLSLKGSYFPDILDEPGYVRLRPHVSLHVDPELNVTQPNGRGSRVTITTVDGRELTCVVLAPRGHSSRGGVTWDDMLEKWEDALEGVDVKAMIEAVRHIEDIDDVRDLTRPFGIEASSPSAASVAR